MRIADYKDLNIQVTRTTKKSSIALVHVDHYAFTIGSKIWQCKVVRKDRVTKRTAGQTLAIAIDALAKAHSVTFENTPSRVFASTVDWVSNAELFDGNYPTVGLDETKRQKIKW